MTTDFKVGDKVKIRKTSDFYSQNIFDGNIIGKDDMGWWRVEFDDGYKNTYETHDLESVAVTNWKGEFV